jgi:hypothetical protein
LQKAYLGNVLALSFFTRKLHFHKRVGLHTCCGSLLQLLKGIFIQLNNLEANENENLIKNQQSPPKISFIKV